MSARDAVWGFVQRVAPGLAARIRAGRAARGQGKPASAEARIDRLEQDLELMAAQLAALTARIEGGAAPAADAEIEARVNAARLGALAFYEERITRLEERAADRDQPGA